MGGTEYGAFFVLPEEMGENFLVLTGENAAHAKVLRLKVGDPVTVCDGEGRECGCTVSDVSPGQVSLVVHHRGASQSEAAVQVRIFMAFPKADKLEHVIQKATELGAAEIIAFPGARCVSRPEERALGKKLERWQKIAGFCGGAVRPGADSPGDGAAHLCRGAGRSGQSKTSPFCFTKMRRGTPSPCP